MRVMNIPKDVYELQECLGYEIKQNYQFNDENLDYSTDEDEESWLELYNGKKVFFSTNSNNIPFLFLRIT